MFTKDDITEELFKMLDSLAICGELTINECQYIERLKNEYFIIKSSEN